MKVSSDLPPASGFLRHQAPAVLSSDGQKSLVLINGRPTVVDQVIPGTAAADLLSGTSAASVPSLPVSATPGDNIAAPTIPLPPAVGLASSAVSQGTGDSLLLDSTHGGAMQPADSGPIRAMLEQFGLPQTQQWQAVVENLLTRFGLTGSTVPTGHSEAWLQAIGMLLTRKLPESALPLLLGYCQGGLRLGSLLSRLDAFGRSAATEIRQAWSAGNTLEKLFQMLKGTPVGDFRATGAQSALAHELAEVFALQELLSVRENSAQEARVYFQWPIFWENQEIPDTLEGEAFYSGTKERDRGFSLRVLVRPPALGACELNLHALRDTLWVHLGSERQETITLFADSTDVLRRRLSELGWKRIQCSASLTVAANGLLFPVQQRTSEKASSKKNPAQQPAVTTTDHGGINIRV